MKLSDLDPATLTQSAEVNKIIATEWVGWRPSLFDYWNPTGNATHAGEARRKAYYFVVICTDRPPSRIIVTIRFNGCLYLYSEECLLSEVNNDKAKAKAESIATSRAIVGALQGRVKS